MAAKPPTRSSVPAPESVLEGVALVTGNPDKLTEARRLCGAELEGVTIELPEIQSLDLRRVLAAKGKEAYKRLGRPLVVEDTALELAAFGGFPGPLVKWMLDAVGAEGIARAAAALGDTQAVARCALLYRDADRELVAEGVTEGRLVLPQRGDHGFGWDPVFEPAGETRTYGELSPDDKDRLGHRGRAWRTLMEELLPPSARE